MASRVYQLGTIVSRYIYIQSEIQTCVLIISFRVNRLLETGVLKERPLWLDVVESFPPDTFPKHNSTPEGGRAPAIVYPEDDLKRLDEHNVTMIMNRRIDIVTTLLFINYL